MLPQTKDIRLAVGLVPVAADAFKRGGAVVQRVGHDSHLRLGKRHDLSAEKCVWA